MRILLQRVSRAEVRIRPGASDDAPRVSGRISGGYVVLVGITHTDTIAEARWMAEKIQALRLFPDEEGRSVECRCDISHSQERDLYRNTGTGQNHFSEPQGQKDHSEAAKRVGADRKCP